MIVLTSFAQLYQQAVDYFRFVEQYKNYPVLIPSNFGEGFVDSNGDAVFYINYGQIKTSPEGFHVRAIELEMFDNEDSVERLTLSLAAACYALENDLPSDYVYKNVKTCIEDCLRIAKTALCTAERVRCILNKGETFTVRETDEFVYTICYNTEFGDGYYSLKITAKTDK